MAVTFLDKSHFIKIQHDQSNKISKCFSVEGTATYYYVHNACEPAELFTNLTEIIVILNSTGKNLLLGTSKEKGMILGTPLGTSILGIQLGTRMLGLGLLVSKILLSKMKMLLVYN